MTEQFVNNALTTLNGSITNVATTLVVTSATSFPASGTFRLRIESEILIVTAVAGTTFTVTRAAEGTTAVAHASGVTVKGVLTAAALAQLKVDAVTTSEFTVYIGSGLVGAISPLALGGGPYAHSGALRMMIAAQIVVRNNADTDDLVVFETDTSNNYFVGTDAAGSFASAFVTVGGNGGGRLEDIGNYGSCMTWGGSGKRVQMDGTLECGGAAGKGGGDGALIVVDNAATDPTSNPTGGGILYASSGAGKWRGSSGTVTTFGPAEPHCPRCGSDVGVSQSENDLFGEELIHCHSCEIKTGNGVVRHVADFFDRRKAS